MASHESSQSRQPELDTIEQPILEFYLQQRAESPVEAQKTAVESWHRLSAADKALLRSIHSRGAPGDLSKQQEESRNTLLYLRVKAEAEAWHQELGEVMAVALETGTVESSDLEAS